MLAVISSFLLKKMLRLLTQLKGQRQIKLKDQSQARKERQKQQWRLIYLCPKSQWNWKQKTNIKCIIINAHLLFPTLSLVCVFLKDTLRMSFKVINGCLLESFLLGETNLPPWHFFRPNVRGDGVFSFSRLSSCLTLRNFTLVSSSRDMPAFVDPTLVDPLSTCEEN